MNKYNNGWLDIKMDIHYRTEDALGELLKEIRQHSHAVRYEAMANIVAAHCQSEGQWVWLHKIDSTLLIR